MRPVKRQGRGIRGIFVMLVLAAGLAFGGPRMIRAHHALEWTRFHAAQPPDTAGRHAREAGRWASAALLQSAPLPWGARAARLALDLGGRQEAVNPEAALLLYQRLRSVLDGLAASRWRGLGLAGLLTEARTREEALARKPPDP
jgi:hypothetical protein